MKNQRECLSKSFYLIFNEHVSKNHQQCCTFVNRRTQACLLSAPLPRQRSKQSTNLKLKLKEEGPSFPVKMLCWKRLPEEELCCWMQSQRESLSKSFYLIFIEQASKNHEQCCTFVNRRPKACRLGAPRPRQQSRLNNRPSWKQMKVRIPELQRHV